MNDYESVSYPVDVALADQLEAKIRDHLAPLGLRAVGYRSLDADEIGELTGNDVWFKLAEWAAASARRAHLFVVISLEVPEVESYLPVAVEVRRDA